MSHHEYEISREISIMLPPFNALIMAAMRRADSDNLEILKAGWHLIWLELDLRYQAPGGILPEDED